MNRNKCSYSDVDYWHQLSKEEKAYLKQFLNEYYLGDTYPNPLLNDLKPSYKRRNQERNDVMLRADSQSNEILDFLSKCPFTEDVLIEAIDLMNERASYE